MAHFYRERGAKLVVVKLGAGGAYYDSDVAGTGRVDGFPVKQVVDTVGAGDGFAAGVVSALLEGKTRARGGAPRRLDRRPRGAGAGRHRRPADAGATSRSGAVMRKKVLVFRELPDDQLARLQAAHEVTVANPRVAAQRGAFDAALPLAQGLIGSSYPVDAGAARRGRRSWK